jgi:hypothetical protein
MSIRCSMHGTARVSARTAPRCPLVTSKWLVHEAGTVMSVAKRRWAEALSACLDSNPEVQAPLRGVIYNLNHLVRLECAA